MGEGEGYKLVPGEAGGDVFRCGKLPDYLNSNYGWCTHAAAVCNGENNCGDNIPAAFATK